MTSRRVVGEPTESSAGAAAPVQDVVQSVEVLAEFRDRRMDLVETALADAKIRFAAEKGADAVAKYRRGQRRMVRKKAVCEANGGDLETELIVAAALRETRDKSSPETLEAPQAERVSKRFYPEFPIWPHFRLPLMLLRVPRAVRILGRIERLAWHPT